MTEDIHRTLGDMREHLSNKIDSVRSDASAAIDGLAREVHALALQNKGLELQAVEITRIAREVAIERDERRRLEDEVRILREWRIGRDKAAESAEKTNTLKFGLFEKIFTGIFVVLFTTLIIGGFAAYNEFVQLLAVQQQHLILLP